MISAPWTALHRTPNRSVRQNVPRRGVIVHHPATTNFTLLRQLVMGARQVSYTAIVNRHAAELMVHGNDRPWSVANAWWDSAMRSICLLNTTTAPGWDIHDESIWTGAHAIAYWAEREGWWPHRDGDPRTWTVIGHGELRPIHGASYATACPGSLPPARQRQMLDLITARAQQLLTAEAPIEDEEDEDTEMPHIILRTPTRGHYSISRGLVSALTSATIATAVEYWQSRTPPRFTGVHVWDCADADLEEFIFALSGSSQIPRAAETLAIVDGAFRPVTPVLPAGIDADWDHDESDLDGEGHDLHTEP